MSYVLSFLRFFTKLLSELATNERLYLNCIPSYEHDVYLPSVFGINSINSNFVNHEISSIIMSSIIKLYLLKLTSHYIILVVRIQKCEAVENLSSLLKLLLL